jgi:YD repeat-containing protein
VNGYEDAQGRRLRLIQDDQLRLRRIEADQQRCISLDYDDHDRITRARDSVGREVNYSYDSRGRLVRVLGPDDRVAEYGYDNQHRMVALNESGVRVRNEYDANNGRCTLNEFWIEDANGKQVTKPQLFRFSYTFDANGKVSVVDVVRPNDTRRVTFSADGYITHETYTEGKRVFGKVYERHARTNVILRATLWCNATSGAQVFEVVQPGESEDVAGQRLAGRCAGDPGRR